MRISLVKRFDEVYVDGRPVKVKRIVAITQTHIVVEHMDGRIEAIPLDRVSKTPSIRHGVMV